MDRGASTPERSHSAICDLSFLFVIPEPQARVAEAPPVIELSTYVFYALRKDEELVLYRGRRDDDASQVLVLSPVAEYPTRESLKRLERGYSFREELDSTWAARPMAIARHWDRTVLVLEDPGGVPLDHALKRARTSGNERERREREAGNSLGLAFFLRVGIGLANAIDQLHQRGIIHKDIKPANVLVNCVTGQCWLMGFGIASRLPRERQSAEPPEFIAGTLAYMAPEQTGRMNRSIDSRSDLYALGVTLYEMLTGSLPFTATDPMEWVHCHIARQPVSPSEWLKEVPATVSGIILKLLAKTAEERYQTAAGVENDLRRCLELLEGSHPRDPLWRAGTRALPDADGEAQTIPGFPLGENDIPDRLLIPEKLYGRTSEIEALLGVFERVATSGRPELLLVSGYAGIGKSSVVNELHKVLVPPRGLFASGKFDQYKRDIPYATLAHAFQSLIRALLGKSEAELRNWRGALHEALGPNGPLMVGLVPELKLIIGEQPPVPELPPQDAQRRFQLVFRRFVGVFARPEHPLALFLDDLQWLDAATLDLLEDLLSQPDVQCLMLLGAYRDNEVNSGHPLTRKLEAIRQAGVKVQEIILAPLTCEDLGRLIADSLHCEPEDGSMSSQTSVRVTPLARLVHEKTGGNPFFAIQFISALAEEALLSFDRGSARLRQASEGGCHFGDGFAGQGRWSWDLSRIQAKGYTDNVVDLMIGKLNRLPIETQKALKEFACLGNSAEITTLSIVHGSSEEELHSDLWEALRLEFIARLEGSYQFVHDRVQEAAYSLIPEKLRAAAHLRIGRLLMARTSLERREEAIFEIVNQLNRGAALITSQEERDQVAELNLIAGKRAKASTAYASALKYLAGGAALLSGDSWERRHELTFALELHRAECEFLTVEPVAAATRLTELSTRAANTVEHAAVTCLRVDLYTTCYQSERAVAVCLNYLRYLGVEWSPHPTAEQARSEYERIWSQLGSRSIEELIDLPLMSDPTSLATLDVLTKVLPAAFHTDVNLASLVICRAVNLSLERGNSDGSCFAYVWLGMLAGPHFGNYEAGFRFGRLGYELVQKRGLKRFQARTYMCFGSLVIPWTKHVRAGLDLVRRAFQAANEIGDLTYAVISCDNLNTILLAAGDPLAEVQREAENGLEFARKARFGLVVDIITAQLGLIRTLRGLTPKFGSFDDGQFEELRFERHLASNAGLALEYWTQKLQARFFAGDYASAVDASLRAQPLLWESPSFFRTAEYHFYGALARAAVSDSATLDNRGQHLKALAEHHQQLALWAKNCPENFETRTALVGAEIARIERRDLDAMRLYEKAIHSARANGFLHNEALAHELAARFYASHRFEKIAHTYLREARYCYLRWGADGKVRQLDELYPQISEEEAASGPTSTIGAPLEHLDFDTVLRASQAISSEIVLDKLIHTLMRTAIEHAGAERGLLILPRGSEQRIEAESTTSGDKILVRLKEAPVTAGALPESVMHFVVRTQETVILDDASRQNLFSEDSYIRRHHPRSILCLPLVNQAKLIGLIYLENSLTPHAFTPDRIAVLKLLASQAAISLENSRLYRDLEQREAKIRRLVDANIIGILIFRNFEEIVEANEAFLQMLGYSRSDLVSGRVRGTDLTPAEWRDRDERAMAELEATGILKPFEKEYLRKDGVRVPVLIGAALSEGRESEGVAFVLDLSERKLAEQALRRSEAYLAQAQRLSQTGSFWWKVSSGDLIWSEELFRVLGYDRAVTPSVDLFFQRMHPEDLSAVQQMFNRAEQGATNLSFEHRLRMPNGSVKHIVIEMVCQDPDNLEFVATVMDITARKHAEEAWQKAQAELAHVTRLTTLGELAASIAHEINQPLGAIANNANAGLRLLATGSENLQEVERALSDIVKGVDVATSNIVRMRALVKKVPPEMARLHLHEVVIEVLSLIHHELTRRHVTIQSELSKDLPPVLGDRVQLQQVLLNLVINGIEAMNEVAVGEKRISIRARRHEHNGRPAVVVSVQDSGVGLKQAKVDQLFEAFYTTKAQGLGMGLAISRSIIEAHGGRLWAATASGPGATFEFALPANS